jgi:hypothetical protein
MEAPQGDAHHVGSANLGTLRTVRVLITVLTLTACTRDLRVGRIVERDVPIDVADAPDAPDAPDTPDAPDACTRPCRPARDAALFHHAVCVSSGWPGLTRLHTDAFDSRVAPYAAATALRAGSAATNGDLSGGDIDVGGALTVAGTATVGDLLARGRVRVLGNLDAQRVTTGALSVGGGVRVRGDLTVSGAFTSPFGADVTVGGMRSARSEVRASVTFPHACEREAVFDFTGRASELRQRNDNAARGLRDDLLAAAARPERVVLPCGRYWFRGVSAGAALVFAVTGHVEVLLDDDVTPADLRVELAPGADVDVIVAGSFRPTGAVRFGDATAPARARLYVLGGPTATLATGFAGLLHAPSLTVRVSGPVYGALRVNAVLGAEVDVHYDVAALDTTGTCRVGACTSCLDCPAAQCGGAACGACADDDDCCAGLRCESGRCVPTW